MTVHEIVVTLGTATPGGGFPVFGEAFACTIHAIDPELVIACHGTKGSAENIPLLEAGELDLALVQGEAAYEAFAGAGRPAAELKVFAAMYSQAGMFCVRAASTHETIHDLVGRRVAFGVKTSGLVLLAKYVLDGLGLEQQRDFEAVYLDKAGDGARLLREGGVEALWGAGVGWPGFIEAMRPPGGRFITPDSDERRRILSKHPFLRPVTLPAFTYDGQREPVMSVGSWSLILTRPTLPPELAYRLVRALDRGHSRLARRLPAAVETTLANTVMVAAPERLQAGVVRYLQEIGLLR